MRQPTTTTPLGPLMVLARTEEHEAFRYKYPVVQRIGTAPDGQPIAGDIVAYATTEANARLIAQGPALYELVEALLVSYDEYEVRGANRAWWEKARAAIRAIDGE